MYVSSVIAEARRSLAPHHLSDPEGSEGCLSGDDHESFVQRPAGTARSSSNHNATRTTTSAQRTVTTVGTDRTTGRSAISTRVPSSLGRPPASKR